ncbi:MAG: FtsB family cell division protein [Pyrinomonadaceae bacterium]
MAKVVSKRPRPKAAKPLRWRKEKKKRIVPTWVPVTAALSLVTMLVLTINYRAYSELSKETNTFEELNKKVEQATSENLSMQEEIHYLKTDPKTIEREARKFGLARPNVLDTILKEKPLEREVTKSTPVQSKKEKVSQAGESDKAEKSASRQLPTRK